MARSPGKSTTNSTSSSPAKSQGAGILSKLSVSSAGIVAALLAHIIELVITFLFVMFVATVDPGIDTTIVATLTDSLQFAGSFWLTAHGASVTAAESSITLAPLGLTLFYMLVLYLCAKKPGTLRMTKTSIYAGAVSYSLVISVAAVLMRYNSFNNDASAVRAGAFSLFIAIICFFLANTKGSFFNRFAGMLDLGELTNAWYSRSYMTTSVRAALGSISVLAICGIIVTAIFSFSSLNVLNQIYDMLNVGPLTAILVAVSQLIVLPNIVLWNISSLFSFGFSFGSFASFSAHVSQATKTLPPLPALASVADFSHSEGLMIFQWVGPAILGIGAAIWTARKVKGDYFVFSYNPKDIRRGEVVYYLVTALLTCAWFGIGCFLVAYLSSGNIDVGNLQGGLGINAPDFTFDMLLKFSTGALFVILPNIAYLALQNPSVDNPPNFKPLEDAVHTSLNRQVSKTGAKTSARSL